MTKQQNSRQIWKTNYQWSPTSWCNNHIQLLHFALMPLPRIMTTTVLERHWGRVPGTPGITQPAHWPRCWETFTSLPHERLEVWKVEPTQGQQAEAARMWSLTSGSACLTTMLHNFCSSYKSFKPTGLHRLKEKSREFKSEALFWCLHTRCKAGEDSVPCPYSKIFQPHGGPEGTEPRAHQFWWMSLPWPALHCMHCPPTPVSQSPYPKSRKRLQNASLLFLLEVTNTEMILGYWIFPQKLTPSLFCPGLLFFKTQPAHLSG